MSAKKRTSKALALLIPTGLIGISAALAATQVHAETTANVATSNTSVADRLSEIRTGISSINDTVIQGPAPESRRAGKNADTSPSVAAAHRSTSCQRMALLRAPRHSFQPHPFG